MSITRLAIEKSQITIVALVLILFAGFQTFQTMPRDEDPGFIIRTATVMTYFPGASPERMEQLVTDKLEKSIRQMPEIDFISSQSKTGVSIIFVNIQERYSAMRPIWDNLRRKVDSAKDQLPDGIIGARRLATDRFAPAARLAAECPSTSFPITSDSLKIAHVAVSSTGSLVQPASSESPMSSVEAIVSRKRPVPAAQRSFISKCVSRPLCTTATLVSCPPIPSGWKRSPGRRRRSARLDPSRSASR